METIFFLIDFCFNDNRDIFLCVMEKPAHKKLSLLSLLSLKTTLALSFAFVLKTIETIETICSFVPLGGIFI